MRPRILSGSNPEYWEKKIERSMDRDRDNNKALLSLGWTVIRFWGCEIAKNVDECVRVIDECVFDQMIADNAMDEHDFALDSGLER